MSLFSEIDEENQPTHRDQLVAMLEGADASFSLIGSIVHVFTGPIMRPTLQEWKFSDDGRLVGVEG